LKRFLNKTVLGFILAIVVLVHPALSTTVAAQHGPDFQKMKAAMDELGQKSGADFEINYINSIIPHHQDAIEMARMVQNDAPHKEVRDVATTIINAQQSEIEELSTWLNDWYGQQPNPDPRMKMSPSMMDMLKQADPTMREKLFLAMMREHHQSAIEIGQLVLQKATHQELKDQAQKMITDQAKEQAMFGGWLQSLYNINPPVPTGDMQHGMDAVMNMGAPAVAPTMTPAGGAPSAPGSQATPSTLPNTGGESAPFVWVVLALTIGTLLIGGYVLRRKAM
jgi:LPXTG-motif cell wall-anchored protein